MYKKITIILSFILTLSTCTSSVTPHAKAIASATKSSTPSPTFTFPAPINPTSVAVREVATASPVPLPTLAPDAWMDLPVVPKNISENTKEIFLRGQELDNLADVFIKIGDSNSTTTWFLAPMARGDYSLGDEYEYLRPAIDAFGESFIRNSVTVRRGFTTSSVLATLWADPEQCEIGETPIACEVRIMKPSFALLMLGSNDIPHPENFEPNMRKIIEELIGLGVVPILATKMDNMERDHSINDKIARLAFEYEIPLWNLWKALLPLKRHGALPDDEAHLTVAGCYFDDELVMKSGWPWRNLTALQAIDAVWRGVKE